MHLYFSSSSANAIHDIDESTTIHWSHIEPRVEFGWENGKRLNVQFLSFSNKWQTEQCCPTTANSSNNRNIPLLSTSITHSHRLNTLRHLTSAVSPARRPRRQPRRRPSRPKIPLRRIRPHHRRGRWRGAADRAVTTRCRTTPSSVPTSAWSVSAEKFTPAGPVRRQPAPADLRRRLSNNPRVHNNNICTNNSNIITTIIISHTRRHRLQSSSLSN